MAKAGAEAAVVETVEYNVHSNSEKTGLHTLHSCSLQTSWSATVFALALSVSAAAGAMFHPSLHKSQGWLCQPGQPGLPHVATPMSRQYGSWSFRVASIYIFGDYNQLSAISYHASTALDSVHYCWKSQVTWPRPCVTKLRRIVSSTSCLKLTVYAGWPWLIFLRDGRQRARKHCKDTYRAKRAWQKKPRPHKQKRKSPDGPHAVCQPQQVVFSCCKRQGMINTQMHDAPKTHHIILCWLSQRD